MPLIHHGFASAVHVGAHRVVGARPAHVQVRPVPRLDQTDEITTLALRGETIVLITFTNVCETEQMSH